MEYWDIYIIKLDRNPNKLLDYASQLIPSLNLDGDSGEYSLDIGTEQLSIINAKEFIYSGCFHKKSEGSIRLKGNLRDNPNGGWVYFNSDGTVVFGLTVKENISTSCLLKLKEFTRSKYGYIAGDGPPAESMEEFIKLCNK
ncbi:MAG: hypothetical protein ACRBHB_01890 [Arenicella sp.]